MTKRFSWLFTSFFCLFTLHSIGLVFYINLHKTTLRHTIQEDTIQEVMNVIHMIQATPPSQLTPTINSIEASHLHIQLTKKPLYKVQLSNFTRHHIRKLIQAKTQMLQMSLAVPLQRWVNIDATLKPMPSIFPHLLVLVFELIIAGIVLFYAWYVCSDLLFTMLQLHFSHNRINI